MPDKRKEMAKDAEAAAEKVGAEVLGVYDSTGYLVRSFSVEIHGADFKKNAEEFAKTNAYTDIRKIR